MKTGLALRGNDEHDEATECFMMAMRFFYSIEEDKALVEEFAEPAVYLAMDSADQADDEVYGEKRREVEVLWDEIRGVNDDD